MAPAPSASPRPAADAPDPSPRTRPVAAILLGCETGVLILAAGYCIVAVTGGLIAGRFGIALAVFLLLFAAATGLAARSVLASGRFGLGFGITWQFFQALVAASMLRGGLYWQGGIALALAIATFVQLSRLVRSTPLPGAD
ncbi:hypothetical protein [Brachybacterium sp. UMB0905]|uniref:hypothetical protein n=1 Tax=Brachybacterium sp. UMB0905 TaxID=2069310 RepID=UPI000C7FCEF6|nr:hypothetical protein [Brachybacterium sp. UMB0905]PMC76552.1 hypothetical protein CJ197_02015 [Brachybacterium sp. UMB0905]